MVKEWILNHAWDSIYYYIGESEEYFDILYSEYQELLFNTYYTTILSLYLSYIKLWILYSKEHFMFVW